MDTKKLADLICTRIIKSGGMTLDQIEERAEEKGIDLDQLYEAMEIVAKRPKIMVSGKKYKEKKIIKDKLFVKNWKYPFPGRDGVPSFVMPFPEIDMSFIFLSPEDMKQYKIDLKGGYAGRNFRSKSYK